MSERILSLPDESRTTPRLKPLVAQATDWVNDIISTWPFRVTAEWLPLDGAFSEDHIGIKIADEYVEEVGVFRGTEMADSFTFHGRLTAFLSRFINSSLDEQRRRFRMTPEAVGVA